jgi:RNA polymerase sigma-70 factor (ECF subfamily)
MGKEEAFIELVRQAQQGHGGSLNQLAQEVKPRLSAYIYRVTLDQDLTQDLSQEALLTMVRSITCLKQAERFWPWLYRIAQSKIHQHYRTKHKKTVMSASAAYRDFVSQRNDHQQDDGLHRLLQKELSRKVVVAIRQLRQQHRAVLSLRCFEQLPYPDIAVTMQCSEVKARVLFFRAKQALKKQLVRQGLSKGMLLTCLGIFGKLTAPADAASATLTVTSASTKVGLTTAVIATAGTKAGVITAVAALVGLATVGGVRVLSAPSLPARSAVKTIHYTIQARNYDRGAVGSLSKGAYEQWYYFPDGVDGPMYMRMQRWDAQQKTRLCAWLQNGEANYYYESGKGEVYINNYRLWLSSLRVRRLPTDTVNLTNFLSEVEGDEKGVMYDRNTKTELLVSAVDDRFVDAPHFRTSYNYNTADESLFNCDWPADAPVVDERDRMHKRGWTYLQIQGQTDGQIISGRGRIPFVHGAWQEHPAWMSLRVGDKLEIIDCAHGAASRRLDGGPVASYPAGSFFEGLARPWMGMHTIDLVRRDAAKQGVWFSISPAKNQDDLLVALADQQNGITTEVIYTVDMKNDLVKAIEFKASGRTVGGLTFSYLQDIDGTADQFGQPPVPGNLSLPTRERPGMLWLIDLARGHLGE